MKTVEGLYYSSDHEWVKVEGNKALIGITDHAQHNLGEIVYVELPEVDDELEKEESFGVVESVKTASDIYMPVSGTVIEVNEELEDSPELVNEDAFGSWFIKVEMADNAKLDDLMDKEDYEKFCAEEE
ncbi:glycine cleavage system protein GcvH [Senegalia massiliensis]|uniref:Glycine cleavage system H protein n=1 Tax=Senegalia massiliensis TaxID=1720316 RepID=A0A845QXM6_9CLOT|nr:glycine cleavage system protein GcvH [Senegalia massiliensis]NBI06744.1 glycine cleavage system protein GcvH [Senegalia massiliensis]